MQNRNRDTDVENKWIVSYQRGKGVGWDELRDCDWQIYFRNDGNVLTLDYSRWLCNFVNVLKFIELYTLNGQILWYVKYLNKTYFKAKKN